MEQQKREEGQILDNLKFDTPYKQDQNLYDLAEGKTLYLCFCAITAAPFARWIFTISLKATPNFSKKTQRCFWFCKVTQNWLHSR